MPAVKVPTQSFQTKVLPYNNIIVVQLINRNLVDILEMISLLHQVITPSERPHIPCVPSPCGPNAQCREVNGHEACTCLVGYVGAPPNCRPECVLNAECPSNKACIQQRCGDPCSGACGYNARSVILTCPLR
jgi:hypothetical protein